MSEPGIDAPEIPRPRPPDQDSSEPRAGNLADVDPGLVNPADLGSASRSCLAIIVVLVIILLLLCVFFVGQQVT